MKVKIGTVFADSKGNYYVVGISPHRDVSLSCIHQKTHDLPYYQSRYCGERTNLHNKYFDLKKDFKFDYEVDFAYEIDLLYNTLTELPVSEYPILEDKDLFIGTIDDTVHTFRIHYPNRVQRLHDNEWATIGAKGIYDFSNMVTEDIFDTIKMYSDRLKDYTFDVPEGINDYKE